MALVYKYTSRVSERERHRERMLWWKLGAWYMVMSIDVIIIICSLFVDVLKLQAYIQDCCWKGRGGGGEEKSTTPPE